MLASKDTDFHAVLSEVGLDIALEIPRKVLCVGDIGLFQVS
jgi:hypothetical protein